MGAPHPIDAIVDCWPTVMEAGLAAALHCGAITVVFHVESGEADFCALAVNAIDKMQINADVMRNVAFILLLLLK